MIFQVQIDQFGFCGWVSISLPKNDKASHMIAKAQSSPEILISIIFLDLWLIFKYRKLQIAYFVPKF